MQRPLLYLFVMVAVAVACCLGGCNPAPRSLAAVDLSSNESLRAVSGSYWRDRAPVVEGDRPRVLLAEFAVEFVTSKHRSPSERQAAFVPPHPVILAAGAAGVGVKYVDFDEAAYKAVAADLERVFRAEAARMGIVLVDAPDDLSRLDAGASRDSSALNIGATDTGRVRGLHLEPGPSLALLDGQSRREVRNRLRAVLTASGAQAAILVRLRVGVFNGYATCEQGSRIEIITGAANGDLVSRASLLSQREVVEPDATSNRYTVLADVYREELGMLAPAYLRMGLMQATD